MMSAWTVRPARSDDNITAVAVLRASITELCVSDHKNDPESLARWLSNKTVEQFQVWGADPSNFVVVAE